MNYYEYASLWLLTVPVLVLLPIALPVVILGTLRAKQIK